MTQDKTHLSYRFTNALVYTARLHADQFRKGTPIPYVSHLLGVTALVLEAGGDEDQAIAALLHDAVEDQGGQETLIEIRERFGDRVAAIVEGCSDATSTPKPPWRKRKETYLAHLIEASPDVLLVSLADKLHNARSIYRDLKENGLEILQKFRGGKSGTLWYYNELVKIFYTSSHSTMVQEFSQVVEQINFLAGISDED